MKLTKFGSVGLNFFCAASCLLLVHRSNAQNTTSHDQPASEDILRQTGEIENTMQQNSPLFVTDTPVHLHQISQNILKRLLRGEGLVYDARVPPNFEDNFPTDVSVQIFVLSFDSLTEISMEYSLSIYLRMNWMDPRLIWNDTGIDGPLEMNPKLIDRVWSPDLYFLNEKEAIVHDVTIINKFMHIYNNGTIHTSTRISMTLSCDMHLDRYPHDEQTCYIYAGSFSFSKENVNLRWHESPLHLRPTLTLPRFTMKGFNTSGCDNFSFGEDSIIEGNFSCIQASFHLQRQFGYYIAQVYIPSILIVVLSWVSFWIDIDAIPARVSLGLLTVLAITTQSTGEKSALPRVSYLKALDVWLAVCLMFVFMALLEFSYVNVQCRVQKRRQETILVETTRDKGAASNGKDTNGLEPRQRLGRRFVFFRDQMKLQRARFVDKCSRVIFPVLFLVFNVTYWLFYRQP